MDQYTDQLMKIKMQKTRDALLKNNMDAYILENKAEVINTLKAMLTNNAKVSVGGSETLFECGVIDLLRSLPIQFDDRYAQGLTRDEQQKIYHRAFMCDYYLASSNAVTMNGELYNVDGTANRVAAITYGPKKVILIVGRNKIVTDLKQAVERVETIAAVANCLRLHKENACTFAGKCMNCQSPSRICCTYVTHAYQHDKNRITVLLVNEDLGY